MQQALQKACKSAIVGDSKAITSVRNVALVLAQAWPDIMGSLSEKSVKPDAANQLSCQHLETEVFPRGSHTINTVRLRVDAVMRKAVKPTGDAQATKPGDSMPGRAASRWVNDVLQAARLQMPLDPFTHVRSRAVHTCRDTAAPSPSSMDAIDAQLAQACSTITDDEVADIVMQMAELLAASGPPYQLSWRDMRAELQFDLIKGLVKEVRLFEYFKVGDSPDGCHPMTVQLLMDKVSADAAEAGQAGEDGEAFAAPSAFAPPLVPSSSQAAAHPAAAPATLGRAPPLSATPPELPTSARPAVPASAPMASCHTNPSIAQGQVFQLSFNSSGQPIYTPRAPGLPSLPATEYDTDDADAAAILNLLPPSVKSACTDLDVLDLLMEVVLDVGRPPVLKLQGAKPVDLQEAVHCLMAAHNMPGSSHLKHTARQGGLATVKPAIAPHGLFGPDNRLGIPGTLHRISAIRARDGSITGLTYRVGRHLPGMADMLSDVMHKVAQTMEVPRVSLTSIAGGGPSLPKPTSVLVLGRPGLGKTTLLRDIARVLADELELAVVVVDSSLEIGGAAAVPHPALGAARRMEVRDRFSQQDVLIEAVQNHAPQVVVIDEIGTAKEVEAVKTIAQRGVAMVATAHGTDLMSIISNPVLAPLLGGIRPQTVGDEVAEEVGGVKTRLERTGPACFTCLVELLDADTYRVHHNLEESVDMLLVDVTMKRAATSPAALREGWTSDERSFKPHTEIRQWQAAGQPVLTVFETQEAAARAGLIA